jgi:hypothetical protein
MRTQAATSEDAWLLPVRDACRVSGLSRSRLYLELASGAIRHKKVSRRTLIVRDSLRAFVDAIPDSQPSRANAQPAGR